jgi:hypothetical protein
VIDRAYREAYRSGIRHTKRTWGIPLAWEMVVAARDGRVRWAARCLRVLLQLYPQGLGELLQHKMNVIIHRERAA